MRRGPGAFGSTGLGMGFGGGGGGFGGGFMGEDAMNMALQKAAADNQVDSSGVCRKAWGGGGPDVVPGARRWCSTCSFGVDDADGSSMPLAHEGQGPPSESGTGTRRVGQSGAGQRDGRRHCDQGPVVSGYWGWDILPRSMGSMEPVKTG